MLVQWLPTALKNLLRITTDLHEKSPQAAHDLGALIRTKGAGLATKYNLYRKGAVAGTRECVAHPNYIIIYRVKPKLGRVEILRIRHAAQKPPTPRKRVSRKTR
ncbi:type II toxin-antitoxin system RelE/ParE family toxin [Burkholderia vietnamiensis]|uniref:type II toxin-antitoxin system RelE/ParE family toxin n=1 Tax=Burkholderia vietnamiensis TaxID=60552 RepID=UPI001592C1F1|nr:type II toxin-antitoxin system RelE/ParE family toxin [Burkholderia vietnamiensis]